MQDFFLRILRDQKFGKGLKVLQVWELCLNFAMALAAVGSSEYNKRVERLGSFLLKIV